MCANSLRLINKNKRKQKIIHTQQPETRNDSGEMLYGAADYSYIWSGTQFDGTTKTSYGTPTTDFDVRADGTSYYENLFSLQQKSQMDEQMNNIVPKLTEPKEFSFLKKDNSGSDNIDVLGASSDDATMDELMMQTNTTFDPRIIRFDAFKSNFGIVPFGSETASSIYYDMVFAGESAVFGGGGDGSADRNGDKINSSNIGGADKVAPNKTEVGDLLGDTNMYGVQSLMNPYSVTRLVGGISLLENGSMRTNMYDVRDSKRFYDNAGVGGSPIILDELDFTSIGNPTVTNIITWSNKDAWGRTPYSFQDFAFCKWWNIIPNNRLITLRKYAVPTYDNLNFPNMYSEDGTSASDIKVAPIATVVTYFGGESANKLNDFMKFVTGTKWKDINADVHKVSGELGSNPRAVIDGMFESGGFGGVGSASNLVNSFLGKTGGLTAKAFSFAKFTGLLQPGGYDGHNLAAFDKLTKANMDPMDSLYSNKIIGPVNRILSVKARDAGLEFSLSFNLVCEYVARPIGGVNTKAAMLDILANCLEVASADAVFWGGGYRFEIHPSMYPFKRDDLSGTVMDSLYAGKIFGDKGAIANMMGGVREFGKNIGNADWSNVTATLGNLIGDTLGAIGNMMLSVASSLFGENSKLAQWMNFEGSDNNVVTEKLKAYGENLNSMWKDQVIQETMMPNIQGMKALLTGEPTGNWHMTVGNPLNPILVIGNLICTKMDVQFGDEIGPDDFPLEMKVTYTLEHAMARDNAAIQSMFNRGAGKIYKLPDYVRAVSDYESKVDDFTGHNDGSWVGPAYMDPTTAQQETYNQTNLQNAPSSGKGYYQTYKIPTGTELQNLGNADTTFIAKFTPVDPQRAVQTVKNAATFLENASNVRAVYYGNLFTQKWIN